MKKLFILLFSLSTLCNAGITFEGVIQTHQSLVELIKQSSKNFNDKKKQLRPGETFTQKATLCKEIKAKDINNIISYIENNFINQLSFKKKFDFDITIDNKYLNGTIQDTDESINKKKFSEIIEKNINNTENINNIKIICSYSELQPQEVTPPAKQITKPTSSSNNWFSLPKIAFYSVLGIAAYYAYKTFWA